MSSRNTIIMAVRDAGWTKILDMQKWQYRYGEKYLNCYSPTGRKFNFLKSDIFPLNRNNKLSKTDVSLMIGQEIIWKGQTRDAHNKLPETIKNLNTFCTGRPTITNWVFMYPWNHPKQTRFKNTLVLLGDGGVECRFRFHKTKNTFKVLEKTKSMFMSNRSKLWKRLKEKSVISVRQMENLVKELV